MKTFLLLLVCVFTSVCANAQKKAVADVNKPIKDTFVINIPVEESSSVEKIANYINGHYTRPEDKIKAIYTWSAQNISYDVTNMFAIDPNRNDSVVIEKLFATRTGICIDYSVLFQKLATLCGIDCHIVTGYAKMPNSIDAPPHAWNVAKINDSWQIFDATWAAGYSLNNKFVKRFTFDYYKIPANKNILTHMPFDPIWQLLNYPINSQQFYDGSLNKDGAVSFFNYADSIAVFEKQDTLTRLENTLRRVKACGIKNTPTFMEVDYLQKSITTINYNFLNTAGQFCNDASALFNKYIQYYNNQFTPEKPEPEVSKMLTDIDSLLALSKSNLSRVNVTNNDIAKSYSSIENLSKDISGRTQEQKAFVEKYYKTKKMFRKNLFKKYSWFGVPLN